MVTMLRNEVATRAASLESKFTVQEVANMKSQEEIIAQIIKDSGKSYWYDARRTNSERRLIIWSYRPLWYRILFKIPHVIYDEIMSYIEWHYRVSCRTCGKPYRTTAEAEACHAEYRSKICLAGSGSSGGCGCGSFNYLSESSVIDSGGDIYDKR